MFSAAASSSPITLFSIEAETSLLNIKLLCEARIRYHDELLKFIKASSVEEIKRDYAQIYKMFEDPKCFNCKDDEIKGFLKNGIEADAKRYQEILDTINIEASSQKSLDHIHFICSQNLHIMRSNEDLEAKELQRLKKKYKSKHKVKNAISAQVSRGYRESIFWKEAIDILDPHISLIQRNFTQDFRIADIGQGFDHLLALSGKGFLRLKKCNDLIQLIRKKSELIKNITTPSNINDDFLSDDSMASLRWSMKFKYEFMPWVKRINEISLTLGKSLLFSWELYREVHEIYDDLKKLFSNLLQEEQKRFKVEVSINLKTQSLQAAEAAPDALIKDTGAQAAASNQLKLVALQTSLEIPNLDAALTAEETEESKLVMEYHENEKRKIAEFKLGVELKRQAKRQRLLKSLASQGNLNVAKETEALNSCNRKSAFNLLLNLNKNNLLLLQTLFETPTPHCQIKYQAIENLFGYEPGKLPGAICGEDKGGSHRKIIIHNTIGYFDVLENTGEQATVSASAAITGPLWKPHMPGHESKMPSVAIRMVCSTLEQVGINKISLELFLAAKEKVGKDAQGIDLDELLDSAHLLENYQRKMTFLMGLHHKAGNASIVRQTFEPSFEAQPSAEELIDKENILSAIKEVFSFL